MRPSRDFTEAQRLRDSGHTLVFISKALKMCRKMIAKNTVQTVEPQRSPPKRNNTVLRKKYKEAQLLRNNGVSVRTIAKHLGISDSAIFKNTEARDFRPLVDTKKVGTGELTKNKIDRVLPTREFDPSKQRHIYIPFMKMSVSVKATDPRTDDDIRRVWAERKAKEDKSFTSPYLAKPVKGKGGSSND